MSMYAKNKLATNPKLRHEGSDYYLGNKKVIPAEDVQEFLKRFYNPATGMRGKRPHARIPECPGLVHRVRVVFRFDDPGARLGAC